MDNIKHTYLVDLIEQKIIDTILYFDVFNYPLTKEEIYNFLSLKITYEEYDEALLKLIELNQITLTNNFYILKHQNELIIKKRYEANKFARDAFELINPIAKVIYKIPFTTGIFISGSLSKNYFDNNSDYDFFIVTNKNRLWICRTYFTIFYKLLPKQKKKFYCLNYFVSENDLKISDQNIFVATELATLIPIVNKNSYEKLLSENNWYKGYLPNAATQNLNYLTYFKKDIGRKFLETIFSGSIGNFIDDFLLSQTQKRWKRKFSSLSIEEFNLQFRAKKNVCKRHTKGFQNKVIANWKEKVNAYNPN